MIPYCAAVDWGTTGFRLWLLDQSGDVLSQCQTAEGLKFCRDGRFESVLDANLEKLHAPYDLPVVICGMAGSRAGWREAPYLTVPASLSDLATGAVEFSFGRRRICIVPGIAQHGANSADIMRGEETQLRGAFEMAGGLAAACMPGTHSKWVAMEEDRIVRFTTFMTGDLFAAIGNHTILAESRGDAVDNETVFRAFLREGLFAPGRLTAGLFRLRSNQILGYAQSRDVAPALSGLLIGTEIAGAREMGLTGGAIALIAAGSMAERYGIAMDEAGIEFQHIDADEAVIAGLYRAARQLLPQSAREPGE